MDCQSLSQVIKRIWTHPMSMRGGRYKTLSRFFRWQLLEKPFHRSAGLSKEWFDGRRLMLYAGRTAATGNYYLGLMEYAEMAFCLAYAMKEDFFIDCGANVGVYSVLLGPECKGGIALEPGSDTFTILKENLQINNLANVRAVKCGAGARRETILFTKGNDTTNHIVNPSEATEISQNACESIEIVPLDLLNTIEKTTILKIDVEGMEKSVLEGAHKLLSSDTLNIVILETFGSRELHEIMLDCGFQLCSYNPKSRELVVCEKNQMTNNGIYIKNVAIAQKRLEAKRRYKILGVSV